MDRRRYLAVTATILIAGCGESEPESSSDSVLEDTEQQSSSDAGNQETKQSSSNAGNQEATSTEPPTRLQLGETYLTPGQIGVSVTDVKMMGQSYSADDEKQRVHMIVEAENRSSQTQSAPYFSEFYLLTDSEQYGSINVSSYQGNTRDLLPDRAGKGYIAYEIPKSLERSDLDIAALVLDGATVRWAIN